MDIIHGKATGIEERKVSDSRYNANWLSPPFQKASDYHQDSWQENTSPTFDIFQSKKFFMQFGESE